MNKLISEKKTPTTLVTVRLICKCGTEMRYLQSSQKEKVAVFVHQCPSCKHKEVLAKAYPYLEYKEIVEEDGKRNMASGKRRI